MRKACWADVCPQPRRVCANGAATVRESDRTVATCPAAYQRIQRAFFKRSIPMIVMKSGGPSVESAAAIERVAGIVRARQERHPVVVVSAMGKTTNKLLEIAATAIK